MARKFTNELLKLVEEGELDALAVLKVCLMYMSEDEVGFMCLDSTDLEGVFDED